MDIRQFAGRGIPIYEELGKVLNVDRQELNKLVTEGKVGFPEVEKAFKNMTSEGGIYFNLMQEQSKSLTGMLSNLGDAWDSALNKIGQDNEGLFTGAIQGAIGLVENMDEILRIVEAVTIAYGSYKAAIALNTLILKGYTGVSFLDNTYKQAKIALLNTEAKITGQVAAQTKAMTVAQEARVVALEKELTAEEQANLVKKLRIATIQQLLTAQQQEYLSNLNLTTSSANYEAVATSVLTVEQREALSKTDLSAKSAVYRAALEQEVAAKRNNIATSVEALRGEVKLAASRAESAKKNSISAMQATEAARASLLAARQSGNASKIATAEKRLETAQTKQLTLAQERMAAVADFNAKKKQLEAAAIQQSRLASSLDTAAKTAQATTTNLLTLATNKLTTSLKALWVSMKANPITWVVSLVGMAYSAISMLSSKTKELEEDTVSLTNATKRATERFSEEAGKVEALEKIIRNSNVAYDERNKALNELKQIIPGYNAELTKEGNIINDNADAIQRYLGLLEKQIRMKAAQEELEAAYREKRLKEKEISQKQAAYDEASANVPDVAYGDAGAQYQMYALNQAGKAEKRLKQAQKELTDINKTIEALNKEISDTSGEIDKSSESAKTYLEQIADTRTQITNLTKELEDLRSGKVVKDNLAAEIDAKIKELNAAKKNLELLTGITTSGNNSNGTNQLSQKELEAQRELEEARISIMEDGYEKRKAILDLQHKENLDRIDREERELEKARKAAGKGGLTATEQEGFDERRSIENTSYQREQNKLFDGEIAYKKQQYELYFRWVRNLGEDVANTQFANLLKGGASFKQYLENQIAEMNQKKQAGTLTEGEGNHLISLNMQYDEITGAKSAMDLFKESVTEAISQATTLAEKVQAIADAKERLANGSTGLVGEDEMAEASLFLSEQEKEVDKSVESLIEEYKGYTKQKREIEKKYNNDLKLLIQERNKAEKNGNKQKVKEYNDAIQVLKNNMAKDLSSLSISIFKEKVDWSAIFDDLDKVSTESLISLRDRLKIYINEIQSFAAPESLKTLVEAYSNLNNKIAETRPLATLKDSWEEYKKSCEDVRLAQEEYNNSLDQYGKDSDEARAKENALTNAQNKRRSSLVQLGNSINALGGKLSEVYEVSGAVVGALETFGINIDKDIKGAIDGIGQIASGLSNMDITRPFSIVTGAFEALGGIGKTMASVLSFGGVDWGGEKSRQAYRKAMEQYEQYISVLDDVIDKQKELVASMDVNDLQNAENSYNTAVRAVQKEEAAARELGRRYLNAGASKGFLGIGSSASNGVKMREGISQSGWNELNAWANANQVNMDFGGRMTALFDLSAEQLATLKRDAPLFWSELAGDVQGYLNKIIEAGEEVENLNDILNESITGVSFESFADSVLSDLTAIDMKAEDVSKNISENLRKSLITNLWKSSYKAELEKYYQMWADALKPGSDGDTELTEKERAALVALQDSIVNGITDSVEKINDTFDVGNEAEDALTGAVRSMSEETGGVIAGRLNAFIINQSDQIAIMRQNIIYQIQIAQNTKVSADELTEIKETLKRIENNGNSLLSQGIS